MIDRLLDIIINGAKRKITKPIFMKEFIKESHHLNQLKNFMRDWQIML